jgi:uncharacterized coiled-coil protein SlyX
MKTEIENRIAALEAELAQERAKLDALLANIPTEFHNITLEVFEKLKALFA